MPLSTCQKGRKPTDAVYMVIDRQGSCSIQQRFHEQPILLASGLTFRVKVVAVILPTMSVLLGYLLAKSWKCHLCQLLLIVMTFVTVCTAQDLGLF